MKILALSLVFSINALAANPVPTRFPFFKPTPQQQIKPVLLPPNAWDSIRETAHVVHAWNAETNEDALIRIFANRVLERGVFNGLVRPQIALIDAAMISKRESIARILIPSVSRVDAATAQSIIMGLRILPLDIRTSVAKQALEDVRNEVKQMISDKYGAGARESSLMPDLLGDWKQIDATGIAAALYGPGSFIHDAADRGGFDPRDRSPMMGMSMDDVKSCYDRCAGNAVHNAKIGEKVGFYLGAALGAAAGAITGTPIGVGAGISTGATAGAAGGGLVGGALGWGMCSSKNCREGSDQPSTPTSSGGTSGGSNSGDDGTATPPATPSGGGTQTPPEAPPENAPANDGPATPPADSGGSDSGPDNCHPGDESCSGMQVNDPENDNDPFATDTGSKGSIGLRRKPRTGDEFVPRNPGIVVDPVRDDGLMRRSQTEAQLRGFAR